MKPRFVSRDLADAIAHALGLSDDDRDFVFPVSEAVWQKFDLGDDALAQIFRQTEEEFDEASKIFLAIQA